MMRTRGRLFLALAISLFATLTARGETKTITVDCWSNQLHSDCYLYSGRDGTVTYDWQGFGNPDNPGANLRATCSFQDQLPVGAKPTRVVARAYLEDGYAFDAIPVATFSLNGTSLGSQSIVTAWARCLYGAFSPFDFDSGTYPTGVPFYTRGGTNTITLDVTAPFAIEAVDLIIDYIPVPPVTFELSESTSDEQRRVLLSNGGYTSAEQPYFSTAQTQDGVIKIKGWAAPGTPIGTPIYMQLKDPPDTAPYQVGTDGDNTGLAGRLLATTMQVQAYGLFETTLQVANLNGNGTGHAASGDNYRVVASFDGRLLNDPSFVCTASTCAQTGVITAWKRAFVEFDRMFKKGTYISYADNAPSTGLRLNVANSQGFTAGSKIVVLHAPQFDGSDLPGDRVFWESATVKRRGSGYIELEPPGVSASYRKSRDPVKPWRADAVGLLTGTDATEVFDANVALLQSFFDEAFVDVKILKAPENPVPYIPYEQYTGVSAKAEEISHRWFELETRDNHVHLIGANRDSNDSSALSGGTRADRDFTLIFESRIKDMLKNATRQNLMNGEVTTHELIHQWEPNGGWSVNGDHCQDEPTYDAVDGALYCIMKAMFQAYPMGPILPEFYDGKVMGHFKSLPGGVVDSEYMSIRKHLDPAF